MNMKIDRNYRDYMNNIFLQSEESFNGIQTPGWTSIMNTEQSNYLKNSIQSNKSRNSNHQQILNRLKSLPKIDEENNFYSNIRATSSTQKNKNVIICPINETQEKIKFEKDRNSNSEKFLKRFSSNKSIKQLPQYIKQSPKNIRKSHNLISLSQTKRSSSFKSEVNQQNLTDRIHNRLSESKDKYIASEFNQKIAYQSANNQKRQNHGYKYEKLGKFNSGKSITRQYFNKYKQKLNQRNIQSFANLRKENQQKLQTQKQSILNPLKDTTNFNKHNRFNSITVHEHLYHTRQKYEAKKNMYKMIDDNYQKETNLTFNPQISEKSKLLAESKFLKKQNIPIQFKIEKLEGHQNCLKNSEKNHQNLLKHKDDGVMMIIQEQFHAKQKQKQNESVCKIIYKRLFEYLADGRRQVNEQQMQQKLQKISLLMIKSLNPIITKIYQSSKLNNQEFINFCMTNNEMISKKNIIIKLIIKMLQSLSNQNQKQK